MAGSRISRQVEGKEQRWCCLAIPFDSVPATECSSFLGHSCREHLQVLSAFLHFFTKWTPASTADVFQMLLLLIVMVTVPLLLFNNKTISFYFIRIESNVLPNIPPHPHPPHPQEKRFRDVCTLCPDLTVWDFKSPTVFPKNCPQTQQLFPLLTPEPTPPPPRPAPSRVARWAKASSGGRGGGQRGACSPNRWHSEPGARWTVPLQHVHSRLCRFRTHLEFFVKLRR